MPIPQQQPTGLRPIDGAAERNLAQAPEAVNTPVAAPVPPAATEPNPATPAPSAVAAAAKSTYHEVREDYIVLKGVPGVLHDPALLGSIVCPFVDSLSKSKADEAREAAKRLGNDIDESKIPWCGDGDGSLEKGDVFDCVMKVANAGIIKPLTKPSDWFFGIVSDVDKRITGDVVEWLGGDRTDRQSTLSWVARGGLTYLGISAKHAFQAMGTPEMREVLRGSEKGFFGKLFGVGSATLKKNAEFVGKHWEMGLAVWAIASGVLKSTDKLLDKIPGITQLDGATRKAVDMSVSTAIVLGSMWVIKNHYSGFYFSNADKIEAVNEKLALATDAAKRKALQAELKGYAGIPLKTGLIWAGVYLLLGTYTKFATEQPRVLAAVDGLDGSDDQPSPYLPWNGKLNYFNSDLWVNHYASWAGTAPIWAIAGKGASIFADYAYTRLTGAEKPVFGRNIMSFSEEEKGLLRDCKATATTPLKKGAYYLNSLRMMQTKARWGYFGLQIGGGVMLSIIAGSAMAAARGFDNAAIQDRAGIRALFSRSLNTWAVSGFAAASGMNPSLFGYYTPGMTLVIPMYDICNERNETVALLAAHNLRNLTKATDRAEQERIAKLIRTFEAASVRTAEIAGKKVFINDERNAITAMINEYNSVADKMSLAKVPYYPVECKKCDEEMNTLLNSGYNAAKEVAIP